MKWRLILDKEHKNANAFHNMAVDAAIQRISSKPTLRLYFWNPPAVSIGRFQDLKEEVDLDFCKAHNIDYVRRTTGGGAVFHEHELTYSFCISEQNPYFSPDLRESYKSICGAVIKGLEKLSLKATYVPINDLLVNNKKISGCAQTRKKGIILQHGTILLKVDVDKMFKVLKVPDEKIRDKMISNVKQRVTSVSDELKREKGEKKEITNDEVMDAIAKGFSEYFDIEFEQQELSKEEVQLANQLEADIFRNKDWLYGR